jgi:hypothetical protein
VAPGAPRIPRALRAFNGMAPAEEEDEPAGTSAPSPVTPPRGQAPARGGARPREPLTIRDLLEEPAVGGGEERFAGLRTALRRLRRGRGPREEE